MELQTWNLERYKPNDFVGCFRSSHQRYSVRNCILRNFAKFTGKHLYQSLFFNKVASLRLWQRCFPVNFAKFLRNLFYRTHLGDCFSCFLGILKSDQKTFQNFFYFNDSPSKMMKNAFCFILKALVVLKIFKFLF